MRPAFPLVLCDQHADATPRPGWIACVHVLDVRVPIEHLSTPTPEDLGQILCVECWTEAPSLDRLLVLCHACVADLLRARELHP